MRVCMYTPHVDMYNHVDNIYIYIHIHIDSNLYTQILSVNNP